MMIGKTGIATEIGVEIMMTVIDIVNGTMIVDHHLDVGMMMGLVLLNPCLVCVIVREVHHLIEGDMKKMLLHNQ